jgi:hypothetical protein
MWSFKRSKRSSEAEAALKRYRSAPREEFVATLAERIAEERPRHRVAWSRLAFAGAASTMILGVFASFGGFGYAASGASSTYSVVRQAVVEHKLSVDVHKSSAASQYDNPPASVPQGNNNTGQVEGASVGQVAGAQSELPFTGLSLLVTVLVGLALLTTGLILRRRERSDS